ncbi:MAG: (2Fe-2S)-binding protein [Gammaproteobacteria bacterium TMED78]|mgnify:CR=1 FL=1|nr:MAG: (2Fe-2S)-binding protein [Gammaproteobacteria bacterium TMED78]|tara:strand:+ start:1109 stop:1570 length:462 start_codon:yes stop_codon:yes gene_type:complete
MPFELKVNGELKILDVEPSSLLLSVLRDDLELSGPRFGCGVAQCGACTVLVDGQPIRSCVTPISALSGKEITTIEGLGNRESPHPLQTAFIEEQAAQCGFCSSGMIMSAASLLEKNPKPTDQDIKDALNANLCRCGTHTRILKAVKKASEDLS